jgi:hypothetical protein
MTTTGQRHELYLSWCAAQDTADNAIGKPWYNALVEDARAAWELLQAAVADAARTMEIDAAVCDARPGALERMRRVR